MTIQELGPVLSIYFSVVAFVLGLVFGSFLNCAAWRIAHGKSFLKGRSMCPDCEHTLAAKDLIPLVSYILTKGKCRYCKKKISVRYPLTELCCGALVLGIFLHDGITFLLLRDFIFVCCLFCLSLVDLEICEIPNGTLLISLAAWALYLPFSGYLLRDILFRLAAGATYLIVFLILSLVMDKILQKESLGGGDIKLYFVLGLYFGFIGTLFTAILSSVLALMVSCVVNKKRGASSAIPFGPFLSAVAYVMLICGQGIVDWYMNLF